MDDAMPGRGATGTLTSGAAYRLGRE